MAVVGQNGRIELHERDERDYLQLLLGLPMRASQPGSTRLVGVPKVHGGERDEPVWRWCEMHHDNK